jgi:uncharacterized protein YukE
VAVGIVDRKEGTMNTSNEQNPGDGWQSRAAAERLDDAVAGLSAATRELEKALAELRDVLEDARVARRMLPVYERR